MNTGDQVVSDSKVQADITDATGFEITLYEPTCPSRLMPGDRATFEVFAVDGLVPPLRTKLSAVDGHDDQGWLRPDVTIDVLERDPARRYIFLRLTNISQVGYFGVQVCANLRSADGALLEVGSAYAFPSSLSPGDSTTAIIYFNDFDPDAVVAIVPQALNSSCCAPAVPQDDTIIESTRVVRDAAGKRFMLVEAISTNNTGGDRLRAQLHAYVHGSAGDRVDYAVAGCNGIIPDGATVPSSFLLPVPDGLADPTPVISSMESYVVPVGGIFELNATSVRRNGNTVTGRVTNTTDQHLTLSGACLMLRDRHGTLVGSASIGPETPLDPGQSTTLEAIVPSTADPASAEIIAYGDNTPRLPIRY